MAVKMLIQLKDQQLFQLSTLPSTGMSTPLYLMSPSYSFIWKEKKQFLAECRNLDLGVKSIIQ